MRHPTRAFKAEVRALEGRLLMAGRPSPPPVQFVGPTEVGWSVFPGPFQIVTQQAGEATVTLSRTDTAGPLQVEVTGWSTGGNVGAADQTVTFAPGQSLATATVPINAGAPNPGTADATVFVKPVGEPAGTTGRLYLKIVVSDPTLPPRVVSELATNQGIVLSFNKPMDPVGASNVNNYSVSVAYPTTTGGFFGLNAKTGHVAKSLRFESARYDPATQTVTLVTKHPILGNDLLYYPAFSRVKRARHPARTAHSSNVAHGLTDLQGNPINADTTPGKVGYRVAIRPAI